MQSSQGLPFPNEVGDTIASTPGVGLAVRRQGSRGALVAADGTQQKTVVVGTTPGLDKVVRIQMRAGSLAAATAPGHVLVGSGYADAHSLHLQPGHAALPERADGHADGRRHRRHRHQVIERTREIGLLRAIGLERTQLRRMVRLEAVVISLFGAVVGLGLGLGWGLAAQRLLAAKGLQALAVPWATIIAVVVGAAVVGLLAALGPALRASRLNVLDAIAHE